MMMLPDYHWEHEPELLCFECLDTGWDADADKAYPCPHCQQPRDYEDMPDFQRELSLEAHASTHHTQLREEE